MKYAMLLWVAVASLLVLASREAAGLAGDAAPQGNGTIVTTFPADSGPGYKAYPDTSGAAGPKHVVDFDGLNFVVHDKATGKVLVKKSQTEFWASVEPAKTLNLPQPNDPRMLYDPLSGRWFAVNTGIIAGTRGAHGYLAVSTSSDPTEPWKGVQLPMPPQDLGFKIGVDKNGFYATYINLTGKIDTMHDCLAIPKADAIAVGGPDLSHAATFHNLQIECFPATDLDPDKPATAPEVLLNKEFGNNAGKLYMYKITWAGNVASISEVQTIPLSRTYSTPNGSSLKNQGVRPPPGGNLRADEGRRTIAVFARGGSVFGCNEAKLTINDRPGILWYEVRVSDGKLMQEGLIHDVDHDYLVPSLAVDGQGNVGIGCTRTSATEFPSIYIMMHAAGDPAGTMRAPILAVPGTTYYRAKPSPFGIGWGNYSPTCVDPSNPQVLWTCQQYAGSAADMQWTSAWTAFQLNPSAASAPARPAAWATSVNQAGLPNLNKVNDDVYRGAQPEAQGFAALKKMGIKTVVNLRRYHSDQEACAAAGLDYVEIQENAWHGEDADVVRFLQVVSDPARQPVFVHCQHGADRTGVAVAAYRILIQGWSRDQAIDEMTQGGYGFHSIWQNLVDYVRDLDAEKMHRRIASAAAL